jgi:precorrin-2 dehydrogenase/sirohydrochlorin ferrochelatase
MSGESQDKSELNLIKETPAYYAILLDLNEKGCVVVGGGQVAERKIAAMLEAKAIVTVISPCISPVISAWVAEGQLKVILDGYDSLYCKEAFLVIAATNSSEVNERVYVDATARGQLINRADCPKQSNFIVPAVVRRGMLSITVSTSGASPALAAEIRQKLEHDYGEEYELYVDFLGEFRSLVQERVEDSQQRRRILKKVLEQDILASIREGSFNKEQWLGQMLKDYITK